MERDGCVNCGNVALKLAYSSSFGFCELALRTGQPPTARAQHSSPNDGQHGGPGRESSAHTDFETCLDISREKQSSSKQGASKS